MLAFYQQAERDVGITSPSASSPKGKMQFLEQPSLGSFSYGCELHSSILWAMKMMETF